MLIDIVGVEQRRLAPDEVRDLRYYRVLTGTWQGAAIMVARTGYTGEDGFELIIGPEPDAEQLSAQTTAVWNALV